MNLSDARILVIGYGNPGRLDDGLGPALAAALEPLDLPGVTVESNYQLAVEDAAQVAEYDAVIFADATVSGPDPFEFRRIEPSRRESFTSHAVAPEAVLAMAHDLFGAESAGFVMAIRGHEFNEFGERLSGAASANLDAAVQHLKSVLPDRRFLNMTDTPAATAAAGNGDHHEGR